MATNGNYEPPRLPTFAERKREKERKLALANGSQPSSASVSPVKDRWAIRETTPPSSAFASMPPPPVPNESRPLPLRQHPSLGNLPPAGVPLSPETFSLLQRTGTTSPRKPLPLPGRARTQSPQVGSLSHGMASPPGSPQHSIPAGALPQAITAAMASLTMAPNQVQSPPMSPISPQFPQTPSRDPSRRLPTPLPLQQPPHPIPQPAKSYPYPTQSSTSYSSGPSTPIHSVPPNPPGRAPTDHGPHPSDDSFARSDTVTSIKSLDRVDMTPRGSRPLPRPPVGVGPSKSLDRGMGGEEEAAAYSGRRRLVKRSSRSTIVEEERGSTSSAGGSEARSPVENKPQEPPAVVVVPSVVVPEIVVPSISIIDGDDIDTSSPTSSRPPNAVIGAPPAIAVTSSDIPSISISTDIPTFSFPDEEDSASPSPSPTHTPQQPASTSPSSIPHSAHAGPGVFCAACDNVIIGRVLTAMDSRWHPECFRCEACQMLLEHVSSYEHGGKAYCHMDYHDRFAPKCHSCETAIVDSRFVTIDDPQFGHRYYHELHFFCGECGDPFLDPSKSSAAGTEASRGEEAEGEDETKDFVIHGKHAFCVECDIKLHKPKCRACKKPIRDSAVETMGMKWHKDCFRCAECHQTFANNCFFPMEGRALCQECFTG